MILLLILGLLGGARGDDTYTLTLAFQRMHCDECKREAEATVKRLPGFVAVTFAGTTAVVLLAEKSPVPSVVGLPKDMGYRGSHLAIQGTVSCTGDKATLVAKGSGATLQLAGDKLAELRKKLGGKNRFQVTGALSGKSLQLESFQPAEWKD
ncbi:MAG TPA: heavy metal-associated domain-containing protein [Planctomycetota bacterium]|nr:heavy metal-associated domain-containing protein [Planctomycetota bacterium]